GMPLGGQRLICLGSAVPAADWTAFAADQSSIPNACAGGSPGAIANVAPGASFIDRRYGSPTSWRGNLSVATQLWNWRATVDGTVSLNRNQQSTRDPNFANVVQFRTADEQRPVFTPINGIVASTGAVSPIGARTDAAFGRVLAIGSDARSIDNEITIKLVPDYDVLGNGWLSFAYTLSSSSMRANGFDATTFGSPVGLTSGRNDFVPRHQFSLQAGYLFTQGLSASIFGNFWSGLPFTPMVGADVNGDGLANDRAFVFSPSAAPDSVIASGMDALLRNGRGDGARCLASQLGRVASRASCAGPWTGMLNLRLDVAGEKLGLGKRARFALAFNNTLGALDQLLHGQNRTHGWGVNVAPDPVLYEVRGFDPSAMRFRYAVNSHFGKPLGNAIPSPFGITLDLSIDFSEPNELQQVRRTVTSGRPGHTGLRLTADSITIRYSHVVLNPYAYLVFYSDSLLLTKAQLGAIRAADSVYRARLDSVWRPLAEYLFALPDGFDAAAVTKTTSDAVDRAWALTKLEEPKIRAILSPLQWQLLPSDVRSILDPKYK